MLVCCFYRSRLTKTKHVISLKFEVYSSLKKIEKFVAYIQGRI